MELLKHSIDFAIIAILGTMGFLALLFTLERMIYFAKIKRNLAAFDSAARLEQASLHQQPHHLVHHLLQCPLCRPIRHGGRHHDYLLRHG